MGAIQGYATPEGTASYKSRFAGKLAEGHFRQREGLWFSSIGFGSYLGEPDEETDRLYEGALKTAVGSGVNVLDSAINYRAQRSERSFGRALAELFKGGKISREEIILCTKGGFIPFDGSYPKDPMDYFEKTYLETGILKAEDVAEGCHAMSPAYLENQLERSLANLGVETIDIYYVHNPETQMTAKAGAPAPALNRNPLTAPSKEGAKQSSQMAEHERPEFLERLRKAFELLERKVSEGKIRMYGTATWNGYRVPAENAEYLSLEEIVLAAREVGGPGHHFKAVQLPMNLAMPEAWVLPNQRYGGNLVPLLGLAEKLGVIVVGSASLLQARLAGPLPEHLAEHFPKLGKSSQRALQFARSVPGITTALVGMKNEQHVRENLETAKIPPMTEGELFRIFQEK